MASFKGVEPVQLAATKNCWICFPHRPYDQCPVCKGTGEPLDGIQICPGCESTGIGIAPFPPITCPVCSHRTKDNVLVPLRFVLPDETIFVSPIDGWSRSLNRPLYPYKAYLPRTTYIDYWDEMATRILAVIASWQEAS